MVIITLQYYFMKNIVNINYIFYLEYGQERCEPLSDQSADNVFKKVEGLVKK